MTYPVFPSFIGLAWDIKTRMVFSTAAEVAASGAKFQTGRWPVPLLEFDLAWNYLAPADLNTFLAFLITLTGPLQPFLVAPTNDSGVTMQQFGTGDGSTVAFQLKNAYTYPITQPDAGETIYVNDWQGYTPMLPTARTNLVHQSQTIDNGYWVELGATITADATAAPDGTTTADQLVEDTSTGFHATRSGNLTLAASTFYTFSAYVKPSGRTSVRMEVIGGASGWDSAALPSADFDLAGVTVSGLTAGTTGTITPAAHGFFRITVTAKTSASPVTSNQRVDAFNAGPSYHGDGASGFYLWGAQGETGSVATRYIPTTTANVTVTDYTLALGLVTFVAPPVNAAPILWTGTYKYLVRFAAGASKDADTYEFNQMLSQMYEQGGLTMELAR
jgi:hypothetical protein